MCKKGENIFLRKDGRWEARYIKSRDGTKIKYGYIYAKTYGEAKKRNISQFQAFLKKRKLIKKN